LHQFVDKLFAVAGIAAGGEVDALVAPATEGVGELERPEEVVDLLEVRADSVELVDDILDALNVELAEGLLDDAVLHQGDALLVHLTETTLVDEVVDGLQRRLAVGDVRLNALEHSHGGEVDLHEGGVVDLTKTQELQDLLGLGVNTVDTTDADNEEDLGHVLNEVVAGILGLAASADKGLLGGLVLGGVLLSTLEDFLAGGLVLLGLLNASGSALGL